MSDLPETMPALILREGGFDPAQQGPQIDRLSDWVTLAEMPVPRPGPGQVLIRVHLAPVNPSDLHFIKGAYGQPRVAGMPAGFEGMGIVVRAGDGAEALEGRRVAFVATASGSWAGYALTQAAICIPLRDDVSDTDGAALIVNPLTARAMLGLVPEGGAVVLTAAGSELGRLMCALGRDMGLKVIAVIRSAGAAGELRDAGAAEVLVSGEAGFAAARDAALKAHKPRILLDAVGDQVAADLFDAMPGGARWVVYGKLSTEAPRLAQMGQFIFMGKRIEGFWLTQWLGGAGAEARAAAIIEVQERFATGRWHTRKGARLGLAAALEGLAPALARGTGKIFLDPES